MKNHIGRFLVTTLGTVVSIFILSTSAQAFRVSVTLFEVFNSTRYFISNSVTEDTDHDGQITLGTVNNLIAAGQSRPALLLSQNPGEVSAGRTTYLDPYTVSNSQYTSRIHGTNDLASASASVDNYTGYTIEAVVFLSDTGYTPFSPEAVFKAKGTFPAGTIAGNSIELRWFVDLSNLMYPGAFPGDTTTGGEAYQYIQNYLDPTHADQQLSPMATYTSVDGGMQQYQYGPYSQTIDAATPFSQTLYFDLTLLNNQSITSRQMEINSHPIPEPSTFLLFAISFSCFVMIRRKKRDPSL